MSGYDPVAREKADAAGSAAAQALSLAGVAQAATALQNWSVVNSNTTASDGQHLSVDTTIEAVTITLPVAGGRVSLRDNAGTWGTNSVTVVGNGATIHGQSTFVLDAPGFQVDFTLVDGAWRYTLQFMNGSA